MLACTAIGLADEAKAPPTKKAPPALNFTVKTIDGQDKALGDYHGSVVLVINVASKCGLTPQYKGLEQLHQKYKARGLKILGFPANDFGAQEPGTNSEIKTFCTSQFGVTFDMFAKVSVKGKDQCPLYAHLTDKTSHPETGGDIRWNFEKFLIDRKGKIVGRFSPRTAPMDDKMVAEIEKLLGAS
jgi:glutathione peroxidase